MIEISKMITLSTAHISPATRDWLDKESNNITSDLAVYKKDNYGWFIYLPESLPYRPLPLFKTPEDLFRCMQVAIDMKCSVLCLDCDVSPLPYLEKYTD